MLQKKFAEDTDKLFNQNCFYLQEKSPTQEKQQKYTALFRRRLSAKITPRVICPARLAFNNKKNDKRHCSCGKKSDKGQNDGQSEIHFIYDA